MQPLLLALALAGAAPAEVPEDQIVRFELSPARPAAPALRFALLPEVRELRPGNAVEHYKKAAVHMKDGSSNDARTAASLWLEMPLKDLPLGEVREFVDKLAPAYAELELAARCDGCDWGHIEGLRKQGIGLTIPEIQDARGLVVLIAVRVRLALAEGDAGRALRDLRTGCALARHLTQSPLLISSLVAVAGGTILTKQLDEVLQRPDSPSLYWALTDLPRPFVDQRRAMQGERLGLLGTFQGVADMADDPKAKPGTPEQVREWTRYLSLIFDVQPTSLEGIALRQLYGLRVARQHEAAKRDLAAAGWPRDKLDTMPHMQVALLHAMLHYDRLYDEFIKVENLPHWEAQERVGLVVRRLVEERRKYLNPLDDSVPALPIASAFLPAVEKVRIAHVRFERRIDALRVVEALRLYAAAHGGALPRSLADVKDVPVPSDPATGKAFGYKLDGRTATLTAPSIPGGAGNPGNELAFEVTMRKR